MASLAHNLYGSRNHRDIDLVLDDFGSVLGRAWPETDEDHTDRETVIADLIAGQYSEPVHIVAFNATEGWSRDGTLDIADELRRRYVEYDELPECVLDFLDAHRR